MFCESPYYSHNFQKQCNITKEHPKPNLNAPFIFYNLDMYMITKHLFHEDVFFHVVVAFQVHF